MHDIIKKVCYKVWRLKKVHCSQLKPDLFSFFEEPEERCHSPNV